MKDPRLYIRLLKHMIDCGSIDTKAIYLRREDLVRLSRQQPFSIIGNDEFSLGLVKYLVRNEMNKIESNFLEDDIAKQQLIIINKKNIVEHSRSFSFTRLDFLNAIEEAYKQGVITDRDYGKTSYLRSRTTFDAFLEDTKEEDYIYSGNTKQNIRVSINEITQLLSLSPEELDRILAAKPFGLTKEEFVHCAELYFLGNKITQKYYLPSTLIENLHRLTSQVDTTTLGVNMCDPPWYASKIKVNEELWNTIINKIPEDFNNLEKAYYVYYQLCKTFTYSKSYFTVGETQIYSGEIDIIHSLERLPLINANNNSVVCYEIMAIFQQFLKHLGLKYDVSTWSDRGANVQYDVHPTLNIIIDEFYIEADATKGVIAGDMPLAKENRPLKGFICNSEHPDTIQKFRSSINKVNEYIANTEKQESSFYDVVDSYTKNKPSDNFFLTDDEKINILMESIEKTTLSETDRLVYISELTKRLFPNGNCQNYFILEHTREDLIPQIVTVFAYHNEGGYSSEENRYFIYSTDKGTEEKTFEELKNSFDRERYEYMSRYPKEIPGIKNEGGDKYAI